MSRANEFRFQPTLPNTQGMLDLIKDFDLLWRGRERILRTPRFRSCTLDEALRFATPYIDLLRGSRPTLGMMLDLWGHGQWITPCPDCGGTLLICSAQGSPLSGICSWKGFCRDCKKTHEHSAVSPTSSPVPFADLLEAIHATREQHLTPLLARPGKSPNFDWAEGETGTQEPPTVLTPGVVPVDIKQILQTLRGDPPEHYAIRDANGTSLARVTLLPFRMEVLETRSTHALLYESTYDGLIGTDTEGRLRWDGLTLYESSGAPRLGLLQPGVKGAYAGGAQEPTQESRARPLECARYTRTSLVDPGTQQLLAQADCDLPPIAFILLLAAQKFGKEPRP